MSGSHAYEPGTRWEIDVLLVGIACVFLVIFLSALPEMSASRKRAASDLAAGSARELGYPEETGVECTPLVWAKYHSAIPCVLSPPTDDGHTRTTRIECSVLMGDCWKTN